MKWQIFCRSLNISNSHTHHFEFYSEVLVHRFKADLSWGHQVIHVDIKRVSVTETFVNNSDLTESSDAESPIGVFPALRVPPSNAAVRRHFELFNIMITDQMLYELVSFPITTYINAFDAIVEMTGVLVL